MLSVEDIRRAADANILSQQDAERLLQWARDEGANLTANSNLEAVQPVEQRKGLNLVTVAYYFGARLMGPTTFSPLRELALR